jgi:RNA polymerase sigma-70 factor, ECF subfamily
VSAGIGVEDLLRDLTPQVLGALVRRYGGFDACEDAVQEALLAASAQWPAEGVPDNPKGWLIRVASRRWIEQWRNETARRRREETAASLEPPDPPGPPPAVDDTLTLLLLCCHPSLTPVSQVALTLRAVGGLSTAEIARALLVPEATVAQRISRAKQRIKASGGEFRMPPEGERSQRLAAVLHVLYLIFNEGYTASSGSALHRLELTSEAIRLTQQVRARLPEDGEVAGLLALMLLTDARSSVRVAGGELVPMHEQDRGGWDRELITEGHELVRECLELRASGGARPGQYQLLAAINAVHTDAPTAADTDWAQIATLYSQLYALTPSPIVALNRAVAVAELDGAAVALAEVDRLALTTYHPWHATRADLLRRLGRSAEAREAYDAALGLTDNEAERAYLTRRRNQLAT